MAVKQRKSARVVGRPFKPGKSGNPKGRPPVGKSLAETVRAVAEEQDEETGRTRVQEVVRRLFKDAKLKGGERAAALLFERGWGKMTTPIEVDAGPLPVRIEPFDYRTFIAGTPPGSEENSSEPG